MNEEIVTAAVMCVSELVTNVVQHAGTSARVTMELADRLLVTVEDTGTWSAPRTGPRGPLRLAGQGTCSRGGRLRCHGPRAGVDGSTVWFEIVLDRESTWSPPSDDLRIRCRTSSLLPPPGESLLGEAAAGC